MSNAQPPRRRISFGQRSEPRPPQAASGPPSLSMPYPDGRVVRWTSSSAPGAPDVAIVVASEVLERVNGAVRASLVSEVGGFLLGNRYACPQSGREFVLIDQCSPADAVESTVVSLAMTPATWSRLDEELTGKFLGKLLVGWYHSHPGHGVFLSDSDMTIQEQRFRESWHCALVVDPLKNTGGFFARRDGRLEPAKSVDFDELLDDAALVSRETRMPWIGYARSEAAVAAAGAIAVRRLGDHSIRPTAPAPAPATAEVGTQGERVNSSPFPDQRSYRWTPNDALEAPSPDVAIVVSQEVLVAVNQLLGASLEREIGGFLLGNLCRCPNSHRDYVVIDQYSPAMYTESTNVSVSFTQAAWGKLAEELSGKFLGKVLVGWYHSHPKMGIFLSQWDIVLHEQRFSDAWKSALVVDPSREKGGFFSRRRGQLDSRVPVEFYELRDDGAGDTSVMTWNGYTCRHAATGAALSPQIRKPAAVAATVATPGASTTAPATPGPAHRNMTALLGLAASVILVAALSGFFLWSRGGQNEPHISGYKVVAFDSSRIDDGAILEIDVEGAPPTAQIRVEGDLVTTLGAPTMADGGLAKRYRVKAAGPGVLRTLREFTSPGTVQDLRVEILDGDKAVAEQRYQLTYAMLHQEQQETAEMRQLREALSAARAQLAQVNEQQQRTEGRESRSQREEDARRRREAEERVRALEVAAQRAAAAAPVVPPPSVQATAEPIRTPPPTVIERPVERPIEQPVQRTGGGAPPTVSTPPPPAVVEPPVTRPAVPNPPVGNSAPPAPPPPAVVSAPPVVTARPPQAAPIGSAQRAAEVAGLLEVLASDIRSCTAGTNQITAKCGPAIGRANGAVDAVNNAQYDYPQLGRFVDEFTRNFSVQRLQKVASEASEIAKRIRKDPTDRLKRR